MAAHAPMELAPGLGADAEFTQKLFRENIQLRRQYTALQRELFSLTSQHESGEEERAELRERLTQAERRASAAQATTRPGGAGGHENGSQALVARDADAGRAEWEIEDAPVSLETEEKGAAELLKELKEAQFALNARTEELKRLQEGHTALQEELQADTARRGKLEGELAGLRASTAEQALKVRELELLKTSLQRPRDEGERHPGQREEAEHADEGAAPSTMNAEQLQISNIQLRRQIVEVVEEANRVQNELQTQLQGYELLLNKVRLDYEEYMQITTAENASFRQMQSQEYDSLKQAFERHKIQEFEDKKRLLNEYQGLLFALQTQFEEYRATAEFLFQTEITKLQDTVTSQAARYEEEILYVLQSKDKFYQDVMVFKDSKIMSLIEGADMQSLMQRHELSVENLRREHAKEVERVKSDQETESKNLITLLHRQNASLEGKCDKLQSHLKSLEGRIKELMGVIESKNKVIEARDEAKLKSDAEFNRRIDEAAKKHARLMSEKEALRHKVIRLNMEAKGEGENTIPNLLKRVSHETKTLYVEFTELSNKHEALVEEHGGTKKRLKERERLVAYLEKEVERRGSEFAAMTQTFEEFLAGRAKQSRHHHLVRLAKAEEAKRAAQEEEEAGHLGLSSEAEGTKRPSPKHRVVKAVLPELVEAPRSAPTLPSLAATKGDAEVQRGYSYLKRFKALSRAFATGDFRNPPPGALDSATLSQDLLGGEEVGSWQKLPLYQRLAEANLAYAKVYHHTGSTEGPTVAVAATSGPKPLPQIKATLYAPAQGAEGEGKRGLESLRALMAASGAPVAAESSSEAGGEGSVPLKLYQPGQQGSSASIGVGGAAHALTPFPEAGARWSGGVGTMAGGKVAANRLTDAWAAGKEQTPSPYGSSAASSQGGGRFYRTTDSTATLLEEGRLSPPTSSSAQHLAANERTFSLLLTPSPLRWSNGCALRGSKPQYSTELCPIWIPDPALFAERLAIANSVIADLYCKRRFLCLSAFEVAFLLFVASIFIIYFFFPATFQSQGVYNYYLVWWVAYTVWGLGLLFYKNWKMAQVQKKLLHFQELWSTPEIEYSFSNFGICCNVRGVILHIRQHGVLQRKTYSPQPAMRP